MDETEILFQNQSKTIESRCTKLLDQCKDPEQRVSAVNQNKIFKRYSVTEIFESL